MKLWTFLTTDIRELNWKQAEDVTKTGTEAAKAVFDLGKALTEQGTKAEGLKEYVGQISSLLDVLNSPLGQVVKDTIPFASVAVSLIKLITEATKREPTLEECMMLVSQAAYLESLRSLLKPYSQKLEQAGQKQASDAISRQLKQLGTKDFSAPDAQEALLQFPLSELAKTFNAVLIPRLQEADFSEVEAKDLANHVAWNTPEGIYTTLATQADALKLLAEFHRNGGRESLEQYASIKKYLKDQIDNLPNEVIFQEASDSTDLRVTYQNLYVPLEGQPLDCNGKKLEGVDTTDLEAWVIKILRDEHKTKHLLFIQGEAGRGKSVFCRMLANKLLNPYHPLSSYVPILIRLRGLRRLDSQFQTTLENSQELQSYRFVKRSEWLADGNMRFLFLLDGFDELLMREGGATGGLKEFLEQVEQFQQNSHHRFVITGRPLALMQVEPLISQTHNIERIELQPMHDQAMQRWLSQWATKVGESEAQNFQQFLQACPGDVQTLAREPLLMYLLARMHREQQLTVQMFEGTEEQQAKIQIYDQAVQWVLEKQRQTENIRLTGLEPLELRQFLTEAATCVVQAGNEIAPIAMLETRLKANHNPAAKLLEKSRQETNLEDSKTLNNLLASFYLKPTSGEKGGSIEFVHKSFGEFLFAERLLEALEDWSQLGGQRHEKSQEGTKMNQELYDLLGYGGLTPEIVSFLTPRLVRKLPNEALIRLFQWLNDFYDRWCEGEFIDADPPTLPQQTMRLLKEQGIPGIGQRQVDVYTGLNTMVLLLELHRHALTKKELKDSIVFYPSGQLRERSNPDWRTLRLLHTIHYSDSIRVNTFTKVCGLFLNTTNLSYAYLASANLANANLANANLANVDLTSALLINATLIEVDFTGANLTSADLTNTDLYNADCTKANFTKTILTSADLYGASLESANLTCADFTRADLASVNLSNGDLNSANLSGTILIFTDLTNASLFNANLTCANLEGANLTNADLNKSNLENIIWNEQTQWDGVKGLETARNVPEALKRQLGIEN